MLKIFASDARYSLVAFIRWDYFDLFNGIP